VFYGEKKLKKKLLISTIDREKRSLRFVFPCRKRNNAEFSQTATSTESC